MSPNINSFVGDLVEMARAMEELPQVKAALLQMQNANLELSDAIAHREERIIELKTEIEAKASTIRSLEVARDDAELRFLEADDRTQRALGFVKTMFGSAGGLIQALEPQVAQPEPVAETLTEAHAVTEQEVRPFDGPSASEETSQSKPIDSTSEVVMTGDPSNVDSWASGRGQSEADPTLMPVDHTQAGVQEPIETKPSGRYSGKRYYDWPTYVSLTNWIAEGGTEEDWHWRPQARPAGTMF